jgi:hypothetical protein
VTQHALLACYFQCEVNHRVPRRRSTSAPLEHRATRTTSRAKRQGLGRSRGRRRQLVMPAPRAHQWAVCSATAPVLNPLSCHALSLRLPRPVSPSAPQRLPTAGRKGKPRRWPLRRWPMGPRCVRLPVCCPRCLSVLELNIADRKPGTDRSRSLPMQADEMSRPLPEASALLADEHMGVQVSTALTDRATEPPRQQLDAASLLRLALATAQVCPSCGALHNRADAKHVHATMPLSRRQPLSVPSRRCKASMRMSCWQRCAGPALPCATWGCHS